MCRQRHAGAGTGLTRRPLQIPGVTWNAKGMVLRAAHRQFAEVQFAQQDGASLCQASDDGGVFVGHEIPVHAGAVSGQDAFGPELVFDGHGDAEQWTQLAAAHDLLLRQPGGRECLVMQHGDVRM
jgi:hypothetical protein